MQNKRQDVIITIDIRQVLNMPDVNGTKLPPRETCDPAKDFEVWRVADELKQPLCILGQIHEFKRMKQAPQDAGCFLPKDYVFENVTNVVRLPLVGRCGSDSDRAMCWVPTE